MSTEPRATYLVKRLESAVRRNLDLELGSHGMTTPQYAALSILRAQPGLSSAQLARRAFVTPQSMQVMVTAFIRDGLVERRADPSNQRILRNHLTPDGELLLLRADEAAAGIEQQMLGGLDAEQTAAAPRAHDRVHREPHSARCITHVNGKGERTMDIGCLFPPTMDTPEHIRVAEELGYAYAYVYDSPTFLADPWMTLALAAERTSRIRIGVAAITPKLRHLVANAGAIATLCTLAPDRVDVVVGSGFTSQLMLGKGPARWAEVEAYVLALKALLRGEDVEWDGAIVGLKHGALAGVKLPQRPPILVAAHGPKGYAVAARSADGVVTNLSHHTANTGADDMSDWLILYYGTVLDDGEPLSSDRVIDAAGPAATFQLHIGAQGMVARPPGVGGVRGGHDGLPGGPAPSGDAPRSPHRGDRPRATPRQRRPHPRHHGQRLIRGGPTQPRRHRGPGRQGRPLRPDGPRHPAGARGVRGDGRHHTRRERATQVRVRLESVAG